MKSYFALCCITLYLFVTVSKGDDGVSQNSKQKREAPRLFPFPRIGRSRNAYPMTWGFPYDKYKREGGLIPFPRVGRSGPKRNGGGGSGALWFGPRLGKVQKRFPPTANNLETFSSNDYMGEEDTDSFLLKKLKVGEDYSTFPTESRVER